MESLYRKYRPQTFADVVGQQHVVETLERAVVEGRTSHAYLFCGPRGTGKTTMARLLSKALLCEKGPGQLPDGTCDQCTAIAEGTHPDVYELDAASRTGVDNVREEIINRVDFAPVRGRYKVYIIDEVHMLTTAAFNALLKTLEEPPAHVVFILCTTEAQKVPETILSRVQRFDFHSISNEDLEHRLAAVCDTEGFSYEAPALALVARHARGGMRDALSTLEQLSVFCEGKITFDAAQDLLGEVASSTIEQFSAAIAARDVPTLFSSVSQLAEEGVDPLQFVRELTAHVRDLYVIAVAGAAPGVVDAAPEEMASLAAEAASYGTPDRLARVLGLLGDVSNEMRTATNQRLSLEVALTRMARPEADLTVESLADRVARIEAALASGIACTSPAPAAAPVTAPVTVPVPASAAPVAAPVAATPVVRQAPGAEPVAAPTPAPATVAVPTAAPAPAAAPVAAPAPSAAPVPAPAPLEPLAMPTSCPSPVALELAHKWKQLVDRLVESSPRFGSLLLNAEIVSAENGVVTASLPAGSNFSARMLSRPDVQEAVNALAEKIFGMHRVTFVMAAAAHAPADVAAPAPVVAPAPATVAAPTPAPEPVRATAPVAAVPAPVVVPAPAPVPAPAAEPVRRTDATSSATPFPAEPATVAAETALSDEGASEEDLPWDDTPPYDDVDASAYEEASDSEASPTGDATAAFVQVAAAAPAASAVAVAPPQAPAPAPAPAPDAAPATATAPAQASAPVPVSELDDEAASIASLAAGIFGDAQVLGFVDPGSDSAAGPGSSQ